MCAEPRVWLSVIVVGKHVSVTLTSFKMSPNIKELLQMSSKTSPKTDSLLKLWGSHKHTFWSSWRKERTGPFQGVATFLSEGFLRRRGSECPWGAPRPGARQGHLVNRGQLVFSCQCWEPMATCSPKLLYSFSISFIPALAHSSGTLRQTPPARSLAHLYRSVSPARAFSPLRRRGPSHHAGRTALGTSRAPHMTRVHLRR